MAKVRDWSAFIPPGDHKPRRGRLPNGKRLSGSHRTRTLVALGEGHFAGSDYIADGRDPNDSAAIGVAARDGLVAINRGREEGAWRSLTPPMNALFEVHAFHAGFREAMAGHLFQAARHAA